MENQNQNVDKEQKHEISIALIQRDIQYINQTMQNIGVQIAAMDKNYARKDELREIEKGLDQIHKDIKEQLAKKVNNTDFDPIKKTLQKINWLVISAVVIALIGIALK